MGTRIALPVGGPEGGNSAYAFPERGVVVDPGPPGAWDALADGLADVGLPAADVEHVFVTHWHVDHAGLAPRLADDAGATLSMHADDAPLVGDYAGERERRVERDRRRLREWGVSEGAADAVLSGDSPSPLPDSFPVVELRDGDDVAGLDVLATPGHTLGHAALLEGDTAYVGDLLLPTYTPNVGGGDTRLSNPLCDYLESVARVRRRADVARPGHGESLSFPARVDEIVAHHDERSRRVAAAVDDADDPVTPWDVARALFGEMRGIHVKMGAGEAATHLAYLDDRGAVERVGDDPVRYVDAEGEAGVLRGG